MSRFTFAAALITVIAAALAIAEPSGAQSSPAAPKTALQQHLESEELTVAFCDYYQNAVNNNTPLPDDKDLSIPGVAYVYSPAEVVALKRNCQMLLRLLQTRDDAGRKSTKKWGL